MLMMLTELMVTESRYMPHQPFLPCVLHRIAQPLTSLPHTRAAMLVIGVDGQIGSGRRASTRKTRRPRVEVNTAPTNCMFWLRYEGHVPL